MLADRYPLSPAQQGMLFHSLAASGEGLYVQQYVCALNEELDTNLFLKAWEDVVNRHGILRTSFVWEETPEPIQVVHAAVPVTLDIQDCFGLTPGEVESRLGAYLREDGIRGFNLAETPLWRWTAFRCGSKSGVHEWKLVWTSHHILLDGRSRAILIDELFTIYDALIEGREPPALPTPPPYSEYIEWLQSLDFEAPREFWQTQLKDLSEPTILGKHKTPSGGNSAEDGRIEYRLPAGDVTRLRQFAQEQGVTLHTLVQGAWAILLARHTSSEDVVFGSTRACRHWRGDASEKTMVGLFLNMVPFRAQADPGASLISWLQGLHDQQVAIRPHEHTPLARIQSWSSMPSGMPLFDVIEDFDNIQLTPMFRQRGGRWSNRAFKLVDKTNYLALGAYAWQDMRVQMNWPGGNFNATRMETMSSHLRVLLEEITRDPARRIRDVPMISDAERHLLLKDWNATRRDFPRDKKAHDFVREQTMRDPSAPALRRNGQLLSYGQLEQRAIRLARQLAAAGLEPEQSVAIFMERSFEAVIGCLAVLKAGGSFAPIDITAPHERILYILENSQAKIVLTQPHLKQQLADTKLKLIPVDASVPFPADDASADMPHAPATARSRAYIIYTSGSTGRPKGVEIEHHSLTNLICHYNKELAMTPRDHGAMVASLAFDASIADIWPCLAAGACLHIPESEIILDPRRMIDWLAEEGITISFIPTALMELMLDETWPAEIPLRCLLTGGDTLRRHPKPSHPFSLINGYGPTENTVDSTWCCVDPYADDACPPIGRPLTNVTCYILDELMQPTGIGVAGELYLGGENVARGYLNNPDMTLERFLPDPFQTLPGARMYKTGDLAKYREDGQIEFLGRNDDQVQIRGFRVELGEAEQALSTHPAVREAVVRPIGNQGVIVGLAAYVASDRDQNVLREELRRYLIQKLPQYMVPVSYTVMKALPRGISGKIDRRALPLPGKESFITRESRAEPRNQLEASLIAIWQEVLRVSPIGINDNFFDLGGYSLLMLRMTALIEKRLGRHLPVSALFKAPTIAQLAAALSAGSADSDHATVISLGAAGAKIPIFCISGACQFPPVVRALGGGRPFYVLEVLSLSAGARASGSVEIIAREFLETAQKIQPHGPYLIGGFCLGGVLAYEMALQLVAAGEQVSCLFMIDSYGPNAFHAGKWRRLIRYFWNFLMRPMSSKADILRHKMRSFSVRASLKSSSYTVKSYLAEMSEAIGCQMRAVTDYRPVALFPGKLLLIKASIVVGTRPRDPQAGWSGMADQGLEIHNLPGDHSHVFDQKNAQTIANILLEHTNSVP
ncbi:MAG: amino acid adenylation domain-containing protein [bacterium]